MKQYNHQYRPFDFSCKMRGKSFNEILAEAENIEYEYEEMDDEEIANDDLNDMKQ